MLRGQLDVLGAGRGSVVLVAGPAGAGNHVAGRGREPGCGSGVRVFCGGGDRAARAVPLGVILDALVSAEDPPVDPGRLHDLSQSPDQRTWLLRELLEALEKAAHRAPLSIMIRPLARLRSPGTVDQAVHDRFRNQQLRPGPVTYQVTTDPGSSRRNATIPDADIPPACDNPTGGDYVDEPPSW